MKQLLFFVCFMGVSGCMGMQINSIHLQPRLAINKPERVFTFNLHEAVWRTQLCASSDEMRAIVRDQLRLAFAIAERTSFCGDSNFFLTDWREESCPLAECQEAHMCQHEVMALRQFDAAEQRAFCARAIRRGVLPEGLNVDVFCASAINRAWLLKHCYHLVFPGCLCRSVRELFTHARRAGLLPQECTYEHFSGNRQLQEAVCAGQPHRMCACNSYKKIRCAHEIECHNVCGNVCAGRGFPNFLAWLTHVNRADVHGLGEYEGELNAFLRGLASVDTAEMLDDHSLLSPGSPDSLVLSPDTPESCAVNRRKALVELKPVVQENWRLLHQIFTFSWLEFHDEFDEDDCSDDTGDDNWLAAKGSPAAQIAALVAREEARKKGEMCDIVALKKPPQRTFFYQLPLTEAQKRNSDAIFRVISTGKNVSPFKGTGHRDAQARSLGLIDRVVVNACADGCLRCLQEKEKKASEQQLLQGQQQALLAWMARQGAMPKAQALGQSTT